jgi:hypothetical protein
LRLFLQIVGFIALGGEPICFNNSIPQSLDTTLVALGIDAATSLHVRQKIQHSAESIFTCFMEYENKMSQNERGGVGAQTDVMSADFIISEMSELPSVPPLRDVAFC